MKTDNGVPKDTDNKDQKLGGRNPPSNIIDISLARKKRELKFTPNPQQIDKLLHYL